MLVCLVLSLIIIISIPLSAGAAVTTYRGFSRLDVSIGAHNYTIAWQTKFSHPTYVVYYNNSGQQVWAGSFSAGTHWLNLGSNVRKVSFFLDGYKSVTLPW